MMNADVCSTLEMSCSDKILSAPDLPPWEAFLQIIKLSECVIKTKQKEKPDMMITQHSLHKRSSSLLF